MMAGTATGMNARRTGEQGKDVLNLHPEIVTLIDRLQTFSKMSEFGEEEEGAVDRAVPKRRMEFRAGRNLARIALRHLGIAECAMPSNADRSPRWPRGVCGSISHTDDWVIVAVTAASNLCGVGIDAETAGSVTSDLRAIIRADEREAALDDTLLFCAKEAVYKAVYPICREFLEFADVSIFPSDRFGEFLACGRSGLNSSALLRRGVGRFFKAKDLVITGFWVYR